MTTFFFYNDSHLVEKINKITTEYEIMNGYIIIKNYNKETNILEISNIPMENKTVFYGKIVHFYKIKMENVLSKINENDSINYIVSTIYANKISGGVYKSYILY
jgi:hypothetical protein